MHGSVATWAILAAALLFIWLGVKVMLIAHDIQAYSYEDLNRHLFEKSRPRDQLHHACCPVRHNIRDVAGAGAVLNERFHVPYQIGLLLTLICAFFVIIRGVDAILAVNSVVVPFMLLLTAVIVIAALKAPNADFWLSRAGDGNWMRLTVSPLLYTGFNLALAQAVLCADRCFHPRTETSDLGRDFRRRGHRSHAAGGTYCPFRRNAGNCPV